MYFKISSKLMYHNCFYKLCSSTPTLKRKSDVHFVEIEKVQAKKSCFSNLRPLDSAASAQQKTLHR